MIEGWAVLEPLQWLDPELPLPVAEIEAACVRIEELSDSLRCDLLRLLRTSGKGKLADVFQTGFKPPDDHGTLRSQDVAFLNSYFATMGRIWHQPDAAKTEDLACQAAFRAQLAFDLQSLLLCHLRAAPTSRVVNAKESPNSARYEHIFRFIEVGRLVGLVKGEHYCIEHHSLVASKLLSKKGLKTQASVAWPYDSDSMYETVLFGFTRAPIGTINSMELGSAITAAGVVRSYLESVVFTVDLESSCSGVKPLHEEHPEISTMRGNDCENALALHRKNGRLDGQQECWAKTAYSMLCRSLHSGEKLTCGEVWAIGHVVQHLQSVLAGKPN